jgi:hypothetical protein
MVRGSVKKGYHSGKSDFVERMEWGLKNHRREYNI